MKVIEDAFAYRLVAAPKLFEPGVLVLGGRQRSWLALPYLRPAFNN